MPGEFAKLLAKLADAEVRCLVVGGVAVCLHGYPRATRDLDILVEATPENARRLLEVLSHWGDGHARELTVEDFVPAELGALRIGEEFVLDVFTLMRARDLDRDLDYAELEPGAGECLLEGGRKIRYLAVEQLIQLKSGTGRPKDELDIQVLREIAAGSREKQATGIESLAPDLSAPADSDQGNWPAA